MWDRKLVSGEAEEVSFLLWFPPPNTVHICLTKVGNSLDGVRGVVPLTGGQKGFTKVHFFKGQDTMGPVLDRQTGGKGLSCEVMLPLE